MNTTTHKTENFFNFSLVGKVFSLLRTVEKTIVGVLILLVALAVYWNWHIYYVNHSSTIPARGGLLIEGLVGRPEVINPILATTPTDLTLVHAIFSGLYTYDEGSNLTPDLATALPEISSDGKSYTVHIRDNAVWHDNTAVTADDVLFTINSIQNEQIGSPLRNLWLATSVTKQDDHTVVFTTKDVSGPFLQNLTQPLLPEHVWRNIAPENFKLSKYNTRPLGCGPFAIHQIEQDSDKTINRISLSSFANYSHPAKLDGITLVFYENGEDLISGYKSSEITSFGLSATDTVEEPQNSTQKLRIPLPQYQAVFLNVDRANLKDVTVRSALRTSLDSSLLSSAAWGNRVKPLDIVPLGLVKNAPETKAANTVEASKLLDKAGWKLNSTGKRIKNGSPLHITLATSNSTGFTLASQQIALVWESLGVEVKVEVLPASDLITNYVRPRNYDALLFSERLGADPDTFAFWHGSQVKDPGLNVSNFSSPSVDKLITDARTSTSSAERTSLYEKLASALSKQVPAIYLNQSLFTYVLDPGLKGANITSLVDPTWRLAQAINFYTNTSRVWR